MTTQNIADALVHIGALMIGFGGAAIIFILLCSLYDALFADDGVMEIVSDGKKAYIKKMGITYSVSDNDIPGIVSSGPGRITISTSKNCQTMSANGFDNGSMNFVQINGKVLINGVDIKKLLEELS